MVAHLLRPGALIVLHRALRRQRGPGQPGVNRSLAALPRMLAATASGRYRGLPASRAVMMGAAAAYVLSPLDLLPEALVPLGGLVDDALVLAWLSGTVLSETEAFLAWEEQRGRGGAGDGGPGDGATAAGAASGTRTSGAGTGEPDAVVPGEVVG